jgi:hypothetical protein
VTVTTRADAATEALAAVLAGRATAWHALEMTPDEFLRACDDQGLAGLMHERLRNDAGCPTAIREVLAAKAREHAATELLRQRESAAVLTALAAEGVLPIVLKGTALAYSVYCSPASRPRVDTDLLIRLADVPLVRQVTARIGYTAPLHCDGDLLFCQFPLKRTDEFGLAHTFDVHWRISTQSVFAEVMTFDEIAPAAHALPALGPYARTAGPVHALLLACIHPAMHHRNVESLLWLYDVHLLASRLSAPEYEAFAALAVARRVSAICAHQLDRARRCFDTPVPASAMRRLAMSRGAEASAAYLRPDRAWGDELLANIRALPRWSDRLRLLREVTLPAPAYMLEAYGLTPSRRGTAVLPLLYFHRLSSGCLKVLAGRK